MFTVHFYPLFPILGIIGLKIVIRGKVAVAGNSRRRKLILNVNKVSKMQVFYKVYYLNKLLVTRTGALSFRIYIIYT